MTHLIFVLKFMYIEIVYYHIGIRKTQLCKRRKYYGLQLQLYG